MKHSRLAQQHRPATPLTPAVREFLDAFAAIAADRILQQETARQGHADKKREANYAP